MNKEEMIELATYLMYENITEGDEGFIKPENAKWTFEKENENKMFISLMDNKNNWNEWFNNEIQLLKDIKGADYFYDLLENPIREPVLITIVNNKIYIWDGWHRIAASIISNKTLPVVFGV